MRAGVRFGILASAMALALAPVAALGQDAAPATNTPATDTIGPRELQDFTLNGTVTRAAPAQPAAPAPVTRRPESSDRANNPPPRDRASSPARPRSEPAPSLTATPPPANALPEADVLAPTPGPAAQSNPEPTPIAPENTTASPSSGYVPWLLALTLILAGAGFLAWRRRAQPRYATVDAASDFRELAQPEARPLPRAAPPRPPLPQPISPKPAPAQPVPTPSGIVSTRLRPWLEIEFSPGRCVVEENGATIQFEVEVYNSGTAPARDVLVEASMFNAGPEQDAEIGAFFAHPVAQGNRIPAIAPLSRIAMQSAVSLTTEQMRQYEVGGRRLFVPLVGFNALYKWSGGDGQTSASYLVGRDSKAEKMAPLRLDLGPRIFRGLGARQHNVGVRI